MRRLVSVAALLAATSSIAYAQNTLPQTNDAYFRAAQSALQERLRVTPNTNRAKNVILFVGEAWASQQSRPAASTKGRNAAWMASRTL
jgi:alkaline phosphatase